MQLVPASSELSVLLSLSNSSAPLFSLKFILLDIKDPNQMELWELPMSVCPFLSFPFAGYWPERACVCVFELPCQTACHFSLQLLCCSSYRVLTPLAFNRCILSCISLKVSQWSWTSLNLSTSSLFISKMTGLGPGWWVGSLRSCPALKTGLSYRTGNQIALLSPVCLRLWNPLIVLHVPRDLSC